MSTGKQHKHEGQEQPTPIAPVEAGSASTERQASLEEALPTDITAHSASPLEPADLPTLLLEWVRTPDWLTSQLHLQTHPELLTEAAEQVLTDLTQIQTDERAQEILTLHQQLLQVARQHGIEAAYEPLLHPEEEDDRAATAEEELQAQVLAWLQTPDWETSQAYLQAHLRLLSEQAEQMLEQLEQVQSREELLKLLGYRQALLHDARIWGIPGTFAYYQLAEQVAILEKHGRETLLQQVKEWIDAPTKEQSRLYFEAHPNLLTAAAEALLAWLWQDQQSDEERVSLSRHLQLLQQVRTEGVDAAFLRMPDPVTLNDDGLGAIRQYETDGEISNLHYALDCWQRSLLLLLNDAPERPALLNNLGTGLRARYERTGMLIDLEESIRTIQQALDLISPDAPERPGYLSNLGAGLINRYEHTGALDDLEAAIQTFNQALDSSSPKDPDRPTLLSNLSVGLGARYERTGALDDLDAAIRASQQALDLSPANAPGRPGYLSNLSGGLGARYERTGAPDDLDAAIRALQQALDLTPPDAPDFPFLLNNLGGGLRARYERTGAPDDLDAAIRASQQALDLSPSGAPGRPMTLGNLGGGLSRRYERTGALDDLDAAIRAFQQALDLSPPEAPERPGYLSALGNGLHTRYERTGASDDLDAAIRALQQALDLIPPDASGRPLSLNNLGGGLIKRYQRTGTLDDLDTAIRAFQQALDLLASDAPDRPRLLSNLGTGLLDRYERTGVLTDLEESIRTLQQAVNLSPPDAPARPKYLSTLGSGLLDRYRRTRVLTDLEESIRTLQQAVNLLQPEDPDRPRFLNTLGSGLGDRYRRLGTLNDLDAAITAFQQAVRLSPPDAPVRPQSLSNLGSGLGDRYTQTGALSDLDASGSALQQALDLTPPDSPDRSGWLSNLGSGLHTRYERTGSLADLEKALAAYQQAADATPPDSPARLMHLNNLGAGLYAHYERTGGLDDLEAALSAWEANWFNRYNRFATLPVLYQLGQQQQDGSLAASLISASLELAERSRPHRQANRQRALEVAEGSKSRLLTQLVGRGPLPLPLGLSQQTSARESQLLRDLTRLDMHELTRLDRPKADRTSIQDPDLLQQRQQLVHELDELWVNIARLGSEGAEYAALRRGEPPTWQDLARLASSLGSTTALLSLFTIAERVFLFLLRAGWSAPHVVETSLLAGWSDLLSRFFREVHRYQLGVYRGETWDQPLYPLLARAQRHLVGVERLILAPAGNGHLLPWSVLAERAGWRTPAGQALSLVTLPALGTLPRLRQRPRNPKDLKLIVGNPREDLPFAEAEALMVARRFGTKSLLKTEATKAEVLSRLDEASLIHLATHAFFDPHNPLDSGIVLADGVLTAREVLEHRLQADLLVLSACQSGQVSSLGGEELAGLSQAFLQAGVRSLLVSLWSVSDPATAALMQAFYDAREAGGDKAQALRQAMTHVQLDPRWSHSHYWGAFVLMGDWE